MDGLEEGLTLDLVEDDRLSELDWFVEIFPFSLNCFNWEKNINGYNGQKTNKIIEKIPTKN